MLLRTATLEALLVHNLASRFDRSRVRVPSTFVERARLSSTRGESEKRYRARRKRQHRAQERAEGRVVQRPHTLKHRRHREIILPSSHPIKSSSLDAPSAHPIRPSTPSRRQSTSPSSSFAGVSVSLGVVLVDVPGTRYPTHHFCCLMCK
jgi:hypothetical protein